MSTTTEKLNNLTLAELAVLRRRLVDHARVHPPLAATARRAGAALPLSFAQQRLWFLAQLAGASEAYHIPMVFDVRGPLDEAALRRALDRLVARHEALRTVVATVDSEPGQRVLAADAGFPLEVVEVGGEAARAAWIAHEATAPFDLATGPLARGRLIRCAPAHHVLVLAIHHIVFDGWSAGVLERELGALYAGESLPALSLHYADYAAWQRRWLTGNVLEAQLGYWRAQLAGAPALLELPADRPRPAIQDYRGDEVEVAIDAELTAGLKALSQRHGATLYMTVLAAWAIVLARLARQADVVIGTPSANRSRLELEGLIGLFVNTLPLRIDTGDQVTVAALLDRVRGVVLASQDHQDVPFDQIVEAVHPARSLAHTPVFQVMFEWQDAGRPPLALAGATVAALGDPHPVAKLDLTLSIGEARGGLTGALTFATALFDRATIARIAGYLREVLAGMVADAGQRVAALPMLSAAERDAVVVAWNATAVDYPAERCIHELFEARAAERPDAPALIYDGQTTSYGELDAQANRLARHLRELGVGPDRRVAICVERSPEMLVGILAIVKAGGAYVPLDPGYPTDRLALMLADCAPVAVLGHAASRAALAAPVAGMAAPPVIVDLIADAAAWAARPGDVLAPRDLGLASHHLAYIIYTSGSTGTPKGAMIEHRALVNRLTWMRDAYGLDASSTALHKTPFTFDVSVWEIFGTLIVGAPLVIARPGGHKDPGYLARLICEQRVASVHFVPSMLQVFLEHDDARTCRTLANVFCSGEDLPAAVVRRFRERLGAIPLHNLYGPTEATVDVTAWACPVDATALVATSIGRPISNTRIYLVDELGQPVPIGVAGELCIGGAGVARGYWNRDALTAERFIASPFVAGDRLYRTGDLARFLASGDIQFLGRDDFQVKLRGFRIELGEIEARLARLAGVREAVVIARAEGGGDPRLVAYYVTDHGAALDVASLIGELSAFLPEYMVPAAFVHLAALPVTANGKIDRKALPAPDGQAYAAIAYAPPVGEIEVVLARIWSEVLDVDRVGRHDDFFKLGGHSLLALRVLDRLRRIGLQADVSAMFASPVLAALAARIVRPSAPAATAATAIPEGTGRITPALVPLVSLDQSELDHIAAATPGGAENIEDIYPLTPLQEGILFHHRMERDRDPYLMWMLTSVADRAALDAYLAAFEAAIARHTILRTAMVWEGLAAPVQVVWRRAPLQIETLALDGDVAAALVARIAPRRYRLDLRNAPLTRLFVAHDPARGRWLMLRLIHHLIDDVTSAQLIDDELRAHMRGHALPAPSPFRHAVERTGDPGAQEAMFRAMLGEVEESSAAFGVLDVHGDGGGIGEVRCPIDDALGLRIRACARQLGVSAASIFHVAWGQVIARASGQRDAVFGTVLFGRTHGGGSDRALGPFINTLPILIRLGAVGAADAVRATHATLAELMGHEQASLALAQRCSRVPAPAPLFTALLNCRHAVAAARGAGDVPDFVNLDGEERTNYPLVANLDDAGTGFALTIQARTEIDPQRVAAMMIAALDSLTAALEREPGRALGRLGVLPAEERTRVVEEWNATDGAYDRERCIHELFEERAAEAGEAVAIRFGETTMTYAALNARANRLARELRRLGVGVERRAAICVERSPEMIVGLLAILKAGGVYVPLDASYPEARLRAMVADSGPVVVLSHAATAVVAAAAAAGRVPVIDVDVEVAQSSADLPVREVGLTSTDLAYVIYTSGSTGTPKGIEVAHAPAINLIQWVNETYEVGRGDCLLFVTSMSFDLSVYDMFGTLAAGGTIWLADEGMLRDPERLARVVEDERVTFWDSAPAALQLLLPFVRRANRSLRLVFNSGDWVPLGQPGAVAAVFPNARFIALGGATEATVWSNYFEVTAVDPAWRSIPYGRPIRNARYYVLDEQLEPVPIGVTGELYIGGGCLAAGYTSEGLTRERFLASPFVAGERIYRTGDQARFWPSGVIEFLGRNDTQVKIRGFRIELGEIEAQLRTEVRDAVVIVREDVAGDRRLVAYYVADGEVTAEGLASHVGKRLPEYMVPTAYVRMSALPVTANGKLDRKALPRPGGEAYASRSYEAPHGEVEVALARIWSEVLGVERISRHDDFFELGGHSLLAVRVLELMRRANLQADVRALFNTPVLTHLAAITEEYGEVEL